jgi:hypothetical protein
MAHLKRRHLTKKKPIKKKGKTLKRKPRRSMLRRRRNVKKGGGKKEFPILEENRYENVLPANAENPYLNWTIEEKKNKPDRVMLPPDNFEEEFIKKGDKITFFINIDQLEILKYKGKTFESQMKKDLIKEYGRLSGKRCTGIVLGIRLKLGYYVTYVRNKSGRGSHMENKLTEIYSTIYHEQKPSPILYEVEIITKDLKPKGLFVNKDYKSQCIVVQFVSNHDFSREITSQSYWNPISIESAEPATEKDFNDLNITPYYLIQCSNDCYPIRPEIEANYTEDQKTERQNRLQKCCFVDSANIISKNDDWKNNQINFFKN